MSAKQAGKYEAWLNDGGGARTAWGGDKCWASAISPGDVVSVYSASHGPTATGHVVTIVTGAGPGEEASMTVVSGNARGEAVQRVQPPPGLFSGSSKRPSGAKQVWDSVLAHHAVIRARAAIEGPTERAWELLDRLAKIYMAPDAAFPAPRGPGYIVRYSVERVGGVGPWAQG